jgi:hypothetical protein
MADTKISALSASTTPLAGTEVLPIVQSGVTRQVSVADLTTGRAVSATQLTLTTGNLIVGTSGQGIDFSATPGTGTSELFNDYEEGTWTPANQSMSVAGTWAATGTYTKIGRQVFFSVVQTSGTVTAAAGVGMISGFPFAPARAVSCTYTNSAGTLIGVGLLETNSIFYGAGGFSSQTALRFSGTYQV